MARTLETDGTAGQSTRDIQAASAIAADAGWDPALSEALYRMLYVGDTDGDRLLYEVARLETKYEDAVYSELIFMLSHLRFDGPEAKEHWAQILTHREQLGGHLGSPIDLRVALVSYFVQVNRQLRTPKIIELQLFEQTRASVYRDELTNLYNFRLFRDCLMREVFRSRRSGEPLSLVMIDVDYFKTYNDNNGHEAGNQALIAIAAQLSDSIRHADIAARYGGEEFALVLPNTLKADALHVADRARARIETHRIAHGESQPGGKLTVSMGVATFPGDAVDEDDLVRCADRALYVAKDCGRNQVQLYAQDRRSHRRVRTAVHGQLRWLAQESRALKTLNLSERGILFVTDRDLAAGSMLQLELSLPGVDAPISLGCRVITCRESQDGRFEVGVRIIELSRAAHDPLTRFLSTDRRSHDRSS